jgi:hypothetical protein
MIRKVGRSVYRIEKKVALTAVAAAASLPRSYRALAPSK